MTGGLTNGPVMSLGRPDRVRRVAGRSGFPPFLSSFAMMPVGVVLPLTIGDNRLRLFGQFSGAADPASGENDPEIPNCVPAHRGSRSRLLLVCGPRRHP